jgi:undecaprenyl-diphosphatase
VVGAAGLALEKHLRVYFEDQSRAWIIGGVLVVNGFIMLFGDFMKRKSVQHTPGQLEHVPDLAMHAALVGHPVSKGSTPLNYEPRNYTKEAEDLSFTKATLIGAAQTFALLPGISRSGVTIVAGLFAGLTYEEASRFTFMLATPVIALAALKKLPELLHGDHATLMLAVYGSIAAFIAAFLSISFLMKYFHHNRLSPFGYFCILFGVASAIFLKYQAQ